MHDFQSLGIQVPAHRTGDGNIKTFCPKCHANRHDRYDKSLSVNIRTGLFKCHYCGYSGTAAGSPSSVPLRPASAFSFRRPESVRIPEKNYTLPSVASCGQPVKATLEWFASRGISPATLTMMRVSESVERMPGRNAPVATVNFNYFLQDKLVNIKYRTPDKAFKMTAGARLIPYNIDAVRNTPDCIITEGEMDALSFAECGRFDAVSVPAGANANLEWLDDFIEDYFDAKEQIFIAVDTDSKGLKLREELVRRFGAERCRIVEYGPGCKDANELLMASGKQALLQALEQAVEFRPEGVVRLADVEDTVDALYHSGLKKGAVTGHDNLDHLISFETKRLCVVTGIPGNGKSEFIDEIAVRLNIRYGWKTAFFSPENYPMCYHVSKLTSKLTGRQFDRTQLPLGEYEEAKRHINRNFFFIDPEDYRLSTILERAGYLVRRHGIKILVIDPYNRIEPEGSDTRSETLQISALLDRLTRFAQTNDVLVVLMAHPTKLSKNKEGVIDPPSLYDISGSAHFYNKADYGLVVHRNRQLKNVLVKVEKVKFRHLGESGKTFFGYNPVNGRYHLWQPDKTPAWDDTNFLTALRHKREARSVADTSLFPDLHVANPSRYADLPD